MHIKLLPLSYEFGLTILNQNNDTLNSLDINQIFSWFKSYNLLLFRGFEADTETFKTFTGRITKSFMPYIGGAYNKREAIDGDQTVLSVTGANLKYAVPLHGEMYYNKNKPNVLWFYCVYPPLKDGETTVCDGSQIYQELSESTKELFQTKRLKYIRTYPKPVWQEIYQTDDLHVVEQICQLNDILLNIDEKDDSITTEYIASAIINNQGHNIFINNILPVIAQEYLQGSKTSIVRFEDGAKIPDEVIREIKEISDRLTLPIVWQQGDILMVDNTRLLHGRRAFADNQRQIYVRLGNILEEAKV